MPAEGDVRQSGLYSPDLAPVPESARTWNTWHMTALWIGMAVCIPTYLLASYMIRSGLGWVEALIIIGIANLIITVPMALNGHAGVKYGLPFPVIGRAAFGIYGIHIPSLLRAGVACGWFGIQTWVGGLAIYAIWHAIAGTPPADGVTAGKLAAFMVFWAINMFFIWKGTESIKWLEEYSAPILIGMGLILIAWGAYNAGGFSRVLQNSRELSAQSVTWVPEAQPPAVRFHPLPSLDGHSAKASEYRFISTANPETQNSPWTALPSGDEAVAVPADIPGDHLRVEFRSPAATSSALAPSQPESPTSASRIWSYILWLTAMVGFWATMSISISDITRFARSQRAQVSGQFLGLPGTMMLYSFVGIFVTCAASLIFDDVLVAEDAPWDPVSLLARFESPVVVVASQLFMLIATLSTNIAANVIAPANAFSNLLPRKVSFRSGGVITGILGIVICPWWLMDQISSVLLFVSGLLGPVLGILVADYYVVRKGRLEVSELFRENGMYTYSRGFNPAAIVSLCIGMLTAVVGYWVPQVDFLYSLSWFTGFAISFFLYVALMPRGRQTGAAAAETHTSS